MCSVLQSYMVETALVTKEIFEAREKAQAEIERMISSTALPAEDAQWSHLDEEDRELIRTGGQREEVTEWQHYGEAQAPTVPLEDAPNPFPMLEPPMG